MRPETFEFSLPDPLTPDSWIEVTGGGLPQLVKVQIAMVEGSPILLGLQVVNREGVTSSSLRAVRLARLLQELSAHLVREWERLTVGRERDAQGRPIPLPADDKADVAMLGLWAERAGLPSAASGQPPQPRGRGAKPPTLEDLRRFVDTLIRERALARRGAVTRASRDMGISRSTAHRWINLCKQQGLLPDEEKL